MSSQNGSVRFPGLLTAAVLAAVAAGAYLLSVPATPTAFAAAEGVQLPENWKPFKTISEYNLFADPASQTPADGVLPFELTTPLFSDYSTKYRFIWMPDGQAAKYHDTEVFDFPVGTLIAKTFAFVDDLRDPSLGQTIVETRILMNSPEGWVVSVYIWNDEQTEADLKIAGGRREVSWTHYDGSTKNLNYIIPNVNQCKGCHIVGEAIEPIGPKGMSLNEDYPYADGVANQLARWTEAGFLSGAPDDAPVLPTWDDPETGSVTERARAYLEVNCAHCHRPEGPANTSGLDLRYVQEDPYAWGVHRTPVAAGRGAGDRKFDIVPGKPDESILLYRLESTEPGIMMPELPRLMVHDEGVALIREWIAGLEPAA